MKISYDLTDFAQVISAKELVSSKVVLEDLPELESVKTLAKWNESMVELFNVTEEFACSVVDGKKQFDRSAALSRLAYFGAEQGWEDNQIMTVLVDADDRWGKYTDRRDREIRYLLPMINRARQKHGYIPAHALDMSAMVASVKTEAVVTEVPLIYGFQDFVTGDFKIDWCLEDLLAQGGLGLVTGYPGVGKTTMAIQMGCNLALGSKHFLQWENAGGRRKVMLLSLEMGPAPLNHFFGKIANEYEDRNTLNRNFLIAPFGTPLPLDREEGQSFLNNILEEFQPDILIIDSMQKIMSKEMTDELAVKELNAYLSKMRARFKCAVVVVHHNRKKSEDNQSKGVELNDVYGSTYITAEADFVLSLKKTATEDMLAVEMLKNRLGKETPTFEVRRNANLSFVNDFADIASRFGKAGLDVV